MSNRSHKGIEGKTRILLNLLSDPAVIIDHKGIFLMANDEFSKATGLNPKELLGKPFMNVDFIDAENKAVLLENLSKRLRGVPVTPYEIKFANASGENRFVEVTGKRITYAGQPADLVLFHDITRRKENTRRLKEYADIMEALVEEKIKEIKESEEKFRAISTCAKDAIVAANCEGEIVYWNPAAERIFGYTAEEAVGKNVLNLIVPLRDRGFQQIFVQQIQNRQLPVGEILEFTALRKDGTEFPAELSVALMNFKGKSCLLGIVRDVSEREKAEAALEQSEARYRSLFENSFDGVMLTKPDGAILAANPQACRMLGMTEEEIKQAGREGIIVKDEKLAAALKEREQTGRTRAELTFKRKDGTTFIAEISSKIFTDAEGVAKSSLVIRDISERKKAEAKIKLQNTILESGNRIFQEALNAASEEKLGSLCLSIAEEITQSKFGFIAELKPNGLEDIAISNPSWDACRIIDEKGHRRKHGDHKIHGIYGRVLKDGKSLLTNNPANHPDRVGFPKGHPPLKAFLGVPLKHEEKIFGMVGVGNREGGYTQEEQQTLETLAPAIVEAFMRKRAEMAVRQSEAQYHGLYEAVSSGVVVQDREGKIVEANSMACEILGLTIDQMQGRTSMDPRWHAVHEDGSPFPGSEHPAMITLRTGKPVRNTIMGVFHPKDGAHRWVQINSEPVIDPNTHKVKGVMTTFTDITKHKKAEEDLRVSEERFRAISNSVRDAIILVNAKETIDYWNPAAEKTFGYTREEAIGQKLHALIVPSSICLEGKIATAKGVKRFAKTETGAFIGETVELTACRKNGSELPIKLSLSPIKLGNIWHVVGVAKDITEEKQKEQLAREYSEKLEKAIAARTNELQIAQASLLKLERLAAIGELAGMVGHDLRNPLTGIKNAAYYLRAKQNACSESDRNKMLGIIDNAIDHSDKIIRDLQDYAREIRLEPERCSPRSILREALTIMQVPDRVKIVDKTLGKPVIKVDKTKMVRVFMNIIKNAVDAMPTGGTLQIKSTEKKGNVEVSFADTGIGMPEETLGKLFSPLVTTKAQGMGFGLAICKRIVEAHQGKITVQSVEGKGSTFTVIVPIEPKVKDGGEATWINLPESLLSTTTKT